VKVNAVTYNTISEPKTQRKSQLKRRLFSSWQKTVAILSPGLSRHHWRNTVAASVARLDGSARRPYLPYPA
jgi:hypothetical protein